MECSTGKPEVFCDIACHDEVIQAKPEICMMSAPKITFIGAGSTIFVKNILGDVFHREALKTAHIALMDIDPTARKSRTLWCVS